MKKTNNTGSPKRREAKSWERHFSGKNLFINALFSFIPVAFIIGVIRELGVRGALPILLIWSGLILVAGIIREKIKSYF